MHVPLMLAGLKLIDKCVSAYAGASAPQAAPGRIAAHESAVGEGVVITWYAVPRGLLWEFFRGRGAVCDGAKWLRILREDGRAQAWLPQLQREYDAMRAEYPGTSIFVTLEDR